MFSLKLLRDYALKKNIVFFCLCINLLNCLMNRKFNMDMWILFWTDEKQHRLRQQKNSIFVLEVIFSISSVNYHHCKQNVLLLNVQLSSVLMLSNVLLSGILLSLNNLTTHSLFCTSKTEMVFYKMVKNKTKIVLA